MSYPSIPSVSIPSTSASTSSIMVTPTSISSTYMHAQSPSSTVSPSLNAAGSLTPVSSSVSSPSIYPSGGFSNLNYNASGNSLSSSHLRKVTQNGDIPGGRFGHTTTYIGENKVVLFGGAVGDSGHYSITDDLYILDMLTFQWTRMHTENSSGARAAHAAACVDTMQLVIFGGATGGGSLSTQELYLLDIRKETKLIWMAVPINGGSPGLRYGHTLLYHKPHLILFGGNNGHDNLSDVWFMDVGHSPFIWKCLNLSEGAPCPEPRVYHSAEICRDGPASGMMVVFGGRADDSRPLRDLWGLRQHRDGRWDWLGAPSRKGTSITGRFQHTCTFLGTKMFVTGGRSDSENQKVLPNALYDTANVEWKNLPPIPVFRHSTWTYKNQIYIFGGFTLQSQQRPTDEMYIISYPDHSHDGNYGDSESSQETTSSHARSNAPSSASYTPGVSSTSGTTNVSPTSVTSYNSQFSGPALNSNDSSHQGSVSHGHSGAVTGSTSQPSSGIPSNSGNTPSTVSTSTLPSTKSFTPYKNVSVSNKPMGAMQQAASTSNVISSPAVSSKVAPVYVNRFASSSSSPKSLQTYSQYSSTSAVNRTSHYKEIKLATHAHAVQDMSSDFSTLVRRISIDRLEDEGRKLNKSCTSPVSKDSDSEMVETIQDQVIKQLFNPSISQKEIEDEFNTDSTFCLSWHDVSKLCQEVVEIIRHEDMVLRVRAPIKVYGDIHGQYYDLMRLFDLYKSPVEEDFASDYGAVGDIDSNDYLFLGDYVDRGSNSLEVICLLFALKLKYPTQIHLIRGNHEDSSINSVYGFQDECRRRLHEDTYDKKSCWNQFNTVFEYLPVGAVIEEKILCIHGGIGGSIRTVQDIENLQKPLKVVQIPTNDYEQRVTDLLWSDPTDNDSILGVTLNDVRDPDGTGLIVKYGPDRVHSFLAANNLQLIIRAHECVMDGFERFAGGKLITLFSATNYCNHHQNAGALLFIRRDMTVIPKLIYPSTIESQRSFNTWDARMTELRPPTPPRARPKMSEQNYGAP